jgi:hypothetical protein
MQVYIRASSNCYRMKTWFDLGERNTYDDYKKEDFASGYCVE